MHPKKGNTGGYKPQTFQGTGQGYRSRGMQEFGDSLNLLLNRDYNETLIRKRLIFFLTLKNRGCVGKKRLMMCKNETFEDVWEENV